VPQAADTCADDRNYHRAPIIAVTAVASRGTADQAFRPGGRAGLPTAEFCRHGGGVACVGDAVGNPNTSEAGSGDEQSWMS
jgi:hypothetical protein